MDHFAYNSTNIYLQEMHADKHNKLLDNVVITSLGLWKYK